MLASDFESVLSEHGYRLTATRKAIIRTLTKSSKYLTAGELVTEVRRRLPSVGLVTVYRTLEILTNLNLLQPVFHGDGVAHYAIVSGGNHHHFVCNHCHEVIEFNECNSDEYTERLARHLNFKIQNHLLQVNGLCSTCQTT